MTGLKIHWTPVLNPHAHEWLKGTETLFSRDFHVEAYRLHMDANVQCVNGNFRAQQAFERFADAIESDTPLETFSLATYWGEYALFFYPYST